MTVNRTALSGRTNAVDKAQDSACPQSDQIARYSAAIPSPLAGRETPAELVRNVATLLAQTGMGNRLFLTWAVPDVVDMRAKLADAVDQLENAGPRFTVTAAGKRALETSVNDRGPLALARHEGRRV